ncbi:hypothetical protein [Dyadobacter alkalitolerans]|nr:hypothetical protein [Dyadobacter alkalitolerans]
MKVNKKDKLAADISETLHQKLSDSDIEAKKLKKAIKKLLRN